MLEDLLLESLTPSVNATLTKVQNIPDHILVKQSFQHGFQKHYGIPNVGVPCHDVPNPPNEKLPIGLSYVFNVTKSSLLKL
jgi:hypothetical protein